MSLELCDSRQQSHYFRLLALEASVPCSSLHHSKKSRHIPYKIYTPPLISGVSRTLVFKTRSGCRFPVPDLNPLDLLSSLKGPDRRYTSATMFDLAPHPSAPIK